MCVFVCYQLVVGRVSSCTCIHCTCTYYIVYLTCVDQLVSSCACVFTYILRFILPSSGQPHSATVGQMALVYIVRGP